MRNSILALLVTTLVLGIFNLLVSLGLVGIGTARVEYEYKALDAQQIDGMGFRSVAREEGIEVSDAGEINFPAETVEKILKVNLLPRTFAEVEKDGGWEFVTATSDDLYLFRRPR